MRYFIKLIQNGIQIQTHRIEPKTQLITTDDLLSFISTKLNLNINNTIIKLIHEQYKLKIIKGWLLIHYRLRSGMQIQIQLLGKSQDNYIFKYQNLNQSILDKRQNTHRYQQPYQQKQQYQQISYLVIKKYEQLLKLIQKNKSQSYFRQLLTKAETIGPCQNQFYLKQLKKIQNQLGNEGWSALHYAVFMGNMEITNYLIKLGVDLNIRTFDDWLPIHFAVKEENVNMVDLLLQQHGINVNICTTHGVAINMAVQAQNKIIVEKILKKDVNFYGRDHLGRTVYDVLQASPNAQILSILQKAEEKQSLEWILSQKNIMYHALVSLYRGKVIYQSAFTIKGYCLCINPYQKSIQIYDDKQNYPHHPKIKVRISRRTIIKKLPKQSRSWYMKGNLYYATITYKKQQFIFACCYQQTINKWINIYRECLKYVGEYSDTIEKFYQNDNIVWDASEEQDCKKKLNGNYGKNFIPFFIPIELIKKVNGTHFSESNSNSEFQKTQSTKKQKNEQQLKKSMVNQSSIIGIQQHPLKLSDFRLQKILGEGAFGTVFLVLDLRMEEKRNYYALKSFKKKTLILNNQIKYITSQLNILKQLSHPYIVNLHFAFQTPNYLYLGLDYCPNQNLSYYLMKNIHFTQKQAMIYIGEILLALEYLHSKNIIYRDLKPQNIMFDSQWHMKLIDFGLSKQGNQQDFLANSFCGSPAYLPPQMLSKKGVRKQSDFYCLGAVLYQMLIGQPPFYSNDISTLYHKILQSKLSFPKQISQSAQNLIINLLQRNPQKRLGYHGIKQIKNHQFFKILDWNALELKQIKIFKKISMVNQNQQIGEKKQIVHHDLDYNGDNYRVNRLHNFYFVRESNCALKEIKCFQQSVYCQS